MDMNPFIIADNQDITKAGMMFLLGHKKDSPEQLFETANKAELIKQLQVNTDAKIILDYTLFDFSGANELIALSERFDNAKWLLFSEELSIEFLRQTMFASNAFSVVLKENSKEEILSALQYLRRGERYICNDVSNMLLAGNNAQTAIHKEDKLLTSSEKSILKEIAMGKTTKEIAAEKNLSFHTINSHRKNIFRKLEVNNVHEAIKYAVKAGIVDLAEYFI